MTAPRASWGIEIGADAIKAMRLERDGDRIAVSDFAVIPHRKVLTTPDLDQDEMVRLSLGQFISQKSLEGEHLVMSVPGHAAFARFAKLPPVEPKKVPDIVKFEAVQQIPFPIDEVEWDYQTFTTADSPEVEVGIFAITRERVQQRLGLYGELGVSPEALTLSPVAVFNALQYDLDLKSRKSAVVLLDIGTQATDVVIAEEGRCWIRTFPLGGTHFTEAIASAFKLSYTKAEKLKKEASTSKYTKQIMQAMRPVFSDLLQDLQRSIGYYKSLHRDSELATMIGIGSTFKIPGLRKFIGQQLQVEVVRLDEFKKISVTGREAASFAEHAVNMATAYGLALQGVGLAVIDANLVPVRALREQMWHAKTKWFAAAAAITVVGAATMLYHPLMDGRRIEPTAPAVVQRVLSAGEKLKKDFEQVQAEATVGFKAQNMAAIVEGREVWPYLVADVDDALMAAGPQPELMGADFDQIRGSAISPRERNLVLLERLAGAYVSPADGQGRRIAIRMNVELSHANPVQFLNDTVAQWLRDHAEPVGERKQVPYRIVLDTISCNPAELTVIAVRESGEERMAGGDAPGGERSARPPAAPPSAARPPSDTGGGDIGRRTPPGTRTPPGARGSGTPGMGGGEGPGVRRETPPPRQPPGARGTPSGTGGTGGAGTPGLSGSGATGARGGSGGAPPERSTDLEALAPLRDGSPLYPPGTEYFAVPITFEVELIDPSAAGAETTAGKAAGEEDRG